MMWSTPARTSSSASWRALCQRSDGGMSLSGTAIPIQCLVAVSVMFFVAVSHVVSCRCGRRTLPACTFCHGTVGSGAFFLDRRPSLLRIPLVGGLPCGGGYLREEGLHGFLCPAVAAATGRSLAGCLPAKRRLAAGRRPHPRRRRHRLRRRRCRLPRLGHRHLPPAADPVGLSRAVAAQ